jgi:hypothetical protein
LIDADHVKVGLSQPPRDVLAPRAHSDDDNVDLLHETSK